MELWRNRALVRERPGEVSLWRVPPFDGPDEPIQTPHAVDPIGIAELRGIETSPQDGDGRVIGRDRHRKRMTVLAAVRKRKARGILEPRWGPVHNFGDKRQRLQRAWPK